MGILRKEIMNFSKSWKKLTLIVALSLGSIGYLFSLNVKDEEVDKKAPQARIDHESVKDRLLSKRSPASSPESDLTASVPRQAQSLPRSPAQESDFSSERILEEWKTIDVVYSQKKYKKVIDVAVIRKKTAAELGLPVIGNFFNQAVIEKGDLPSNVKYSSLVYSEKRMQFSILTNNLVIKFANEETFDRFVEQTNDGTLIGKFRPIRTVIIDGQNETTANALLEKFQKMSEVENVQIEIIEQSKIPR
ncbi:MAG: hypothetical protein Fur0010_17750 [Bdellovibrio sp.]